MKSGAAAPAEETVDSQSIVIAPAETYSDFWRKLLDVALPAMKNSFFATGASASVFPYDPI